MKLIKCSQCGRLYYDSETQCPYCGNDTSLSAANVITTPISDPAAHRHMEETLSSGKRPGAIEQPIPEPIEEETVMPVDPIEGPVEEEPGSEVVVPPSETAQGRADAIAAIQVENPANDEAEESVVEESDADTTPLPRKRRGWIAWLIVLLMLAAAAAVCYLKWDVVSQKLPFLNKTAEQANPAPEAVEPEATTHADDVLFEATETIDEAEPAEEETTEEAETAESEE